MNKKQLFIIYFVFYVLNTSALLFLCAMMQEQIYSYNQLYNFTQKIFEAIGCPQPQAVTATRVLLSADLRGIDSHGIARLSGYVRLWEAKRVNATPLLKIIHETP
ncbi:MAG TPA: Ldh family oxidoreductase, partial [Niabella sp.]|nr:Ldh family oxidoreductase [Niabella sp.]